MTDAPQAAESSTAAQPPPEESLTLAGIVQRVINFESFSVFVATIALGLVIYILHPGFGQPDQLKDMLQQSVYIGVLAQALLRGDVGELSLRGCNHFLLHQLGRWQVLGLDLPTYAERIRAAHRDRRRRPR